MKNKKKKKLTLDEFIDIGRSDIIVYVGATFILLTIFLYISIKYNVYFYLLIIGLIMVSRVYERINAYITLKQIKRYLIINNLLNKIGNIDYWNEKYYFLTDNYMIIKQGKEIYSFEYSEIEKIYKENNLILNKHSQSQEYLHVIVGNKDFIILIYSTVLVGEDFKDISDYLIKKNPTIVIGETIKNKKIDIFRIK